MSGDAPLSTPPQQEFLDAAADEARRSAGDSYYTGCRVRNDSNTVELWLANAPPRLLQELEAMHPGTYVIHNDAVRPRQVLLRLTDSLDPVALKSEGIQVVGWGPTEDGYLSVRVMGDVPTAQARLDAMYGHDVVRVEYGEPARAV